MPSTVTCTFALQKFSKIVPPRMPSLDNNSQDKILLMRVCGKIGENFLLVKIFAATCTCVHQLYTIIDIRSDVGHRCKRAEFQNESTRKHL